jgi:hypothetical protein
LLYLAQTTSRKVKAREQSHYRTYTNKIDRKPINFLLCDPAVLRPLIAIELDDKSHQRADRRARDAFVDEVFRAARLPIIMYPSEHPIKQLTSPLRLHLTWPPCPKRLCPALHCQKPRPAGGAPITGTIS